MHRPLLFAALLLLAASIPVCAQRGGGHGSFGGHGGMSAHGSFSGHMGAGRVSGGMRSGAGFASGVRSRQSFGFRSFNNNFRGRDFRGDRFHSFRDRDFARDRFRRNCFGFGFGCSGFGYPWWDAGAFDPYWWWDSGSSYDQDQQNQIDMANEMNAQSLDEQRMREERQQDDQYAYRQSAPPPRASRQVDRPEVVPNTVLVFRDGHKEEVQNYAIVGQTLWNFAPQRRQKIPLSDLNLQGTAKANEERGVDFHVPNLQEGQ